MESTERRTENSAAQLYAHYFASRARKELIVSTSPDLRGHLSTVSITAVAGKKQAREIALKNNAKPWNF